MTLICACNGSYYGGGFHPVPEARPDDGLLDFLIIKGVSRATFAKLVGEYAKGNYAKYPKYITHIRSTKMEISAAQSPDTLIMQYEERAKATPLYQEISQITDLYEFRRRANRIVMNDENKALLCEVVSVDELSGRQQVQANMQRNQQPAMAPQRQMGGPN